jgi:alginate O-acetyltransferase complex protein AlgJ
MTVFKKRAVPFILFLYLPLVLAAVLYIPWIGKEKFSDYLRLHFPIRQWAVRGNALVQIKLLNNKNLGNIHMGKYPWVFYLTESDGNSLHDLWGKPKENIANLWSKYLRKTKKNPFGFDAHYILLLPPNKETVYRENTDFLFLDDVQQENKNYFKVIRKAQEIHPDGFVPLLDMLLKGKEQFQTYHSGDTHWNKWGAYLAYREVLAGVNKVLSSDILPVDAEPKIMPGEASHDILNMFNGTEKVISYVLDSGKNIGVSFDACCVEPLVDESSYQVYENPEATRVMWFVGDSFGEVIIPFFAPHFRKVVFIKGVGKVLRKTIHRAFMEHGPPDLIIEERVERYLSNPVDYVDYAAEVVKKSSTK